MRKVFISYARVNRVHVDRLVENLGVLGYQTWIDSTLKGGQQWWDEILQNIAECDVFLSIVSRDALNSIACQREFEWAHALHKPVLPVAVEPLSTALPARLSTLHVIEYFDAAQAERNALALAGALSTLPPTPALPHPMPAPPAAPLSYLTDLVELVSGPTPLDHDQQRQLLVHVERALRSVDPHERQGGLDVLERFSSKDNLYADVDRRLAWLKANTTSPAPPQPPPAAGRQRRGRLPTTSPATRAAPAASAQTPKSRKRKLALGAALAVVAVVCVVAYLVWPHSASPTQAAESTDVLKADAQPASPGGSTAQSNSPGGSTAKPAQPASSAGQSELPFSGLLQAVAVAVDRDGNVYVADTSSGVHELSAGATASVKMPATGVGTPDGVAVDTGGNVYIADYSRNAVWKLASGSTAPTLLQFDGLKCGNHDSKIANPEGLALDGAGTLYVADAACAGRILALTAGSSTPTVLPFTDLEFAGSTPTGVAVDGSGNVYVSDVGTGRVLKLGPGASIPSVLPFTGLSLPSGIAVDKSGDVYVTDSGNKRMLKLAAGSTTPTTVPFTFKGTPSGVAVDSAGNIYVAEGNRVLKLGPG